MHKVHFVAMRDGRFVGNARCGKMLAPYATNEREKVTCAACMASLAKLDAKRAKVTR